jgi:hypothetical protein
MFQLTLQHFINEQQHRRSCAHTSVFAYGQTQRLDSLRRRIDRLDMTAKTYWLLRIEEMADNVNLYFKILQGCNAGLRNRDRQETEFAGYAIDYFTRLEWNITRFYKELETEISLERQVSDLDRWTKQAI